MKPLKCPKCGKPIEILEGGMSGAIGASLRFSLEEGKYIPCVAISRALM